MDAVGKASSQRQLMRKHITHIPGQKHARNPAVVAVIFSHHEHHDYDYIDAAITLVFCVILAVHV